MTTSEIHLDSRVIVGEKGRVDGTISARSVEISGKVVGNVKGKELKHAVGKFVEQMKPHLAVAAENDVTIAIENHGNSLINSPDSLKWLIELCSDKHLGIAFAPYHLPQRQRQK